MRAFNKYISDANEYKNDPNAEPIAPVEFVVPTTNDEPSDLTSSTKPRAKGGRPKNETKNEVSENSMLHKRKIEQTMELASEMYMEARKKAKDSKKNKYLVTL